MKPVYLIDHLYDLKPRPNVHADDLSRLTGRLIVETAVLAALLLLIAMAV